MVRSQAFGIKISFGPRKYFYCIIKFMPLLRIVNYPDPVLLKVGMPIGSDGCDPELDGFVANMFETMSEAGGVGLAAPQVGVSKRLFVMDTPETDEFDRVRAVLIDPEVVHVEGEQIGDEGCLSFPGLFQTVRREMRVIARALDQKGEPIELDVRGLAARCILHEIDHCDGIVFLDRMTALKRELAKQKIKRLKRSGKWDRS